MNKKVIAAMSGGVDSLVCAVLLKNSGYDVSGVTLKMFESANTGCCSDSFIDDAKKAADNLGIEHIVLSSEETFRENVIEAFISAYEDGLTPNPCVNCNRYVKFKMILEKINELDADYIATGHYAQVSYDEKIKRYLLKKAEDRKKDQTYFLYNLKQDELRHVLFPLGSLTKEEVRKIAEREGFSNANKPDSQDICFIPNGDYGEFIRKYRNINITEGDFVDKDGNFLGKHKGYINYTTGQRKGLGVAFGKPMYVTGKNKDKNLVILGDEKDLYTNVLYAKDINLISVPDIKGDMKITAKTRYSQSEVPATVTQISKDCIKIVFDEPVRAVTCGQAVVMYDGDTVVGGGIIEKTGAV